MTPQDIEAAEKFCVEVWNIAEPDVIDVYHAVRVLFVSRGQEPPLFDEFRSEWMKDE